MTDPSNLHGPGEFEADQPEIDELLAGHALGDLAPEDCEQVERLIRNNPALKERLEEFRASLQLLPLALPINGEASPDLRERLVQMDQPIASVPERRVSRRHTLWKKRRQQIMLALVGLGLIVLGLQQQRTMQQLAAIEETLSTGATGATAARDGGAQRQISLISTNPAMRAAGELVVTGNRTHNVLLLNQLPPAPQGQVYRLWAQVDGEQVGCVAFAPTTQGHVGLLIPTTPTTRADVISVSLESSPSGHTPTGPVVLSSRGQGADI